MLTRKNTVRNSQLGVSISELLVVLAISGVMAAFAVTQFGNASDIFDTQNVAREIKVNFERARFDSVKRRPASLADGSRITFNSSTSITVVYDRDQNGVLDAADSKTINFAVSSKAKFYNQTSAFPITVVFDRRGHIRSTDSAGNPVIPKFVVCNACESNAIGNVGSYVVSVSNTGTVSNYNYGEAQGTLANPAVTSINSNSGINPMITVGGGPAPAGTPAVTPTPDPTPVATPTPNPTPTPVPTPTPAVCQRNDRPAVTGCMCVAPMRVYSNGQCK